MLRKMTIEDYENVSALWHKIKGFSIRCIGDSREGGGRVRGGGGVAQETRMACTGMLKAPVAGSLAKIIK